MLWDEAGELESAIHRLEKELKEKRSRLQQIQSDCSHQWGETQYTPEHTPAYTIPGDPPGTLGIDWRGDTQVPAKTVDKWTRRCLKCGLKQTTTEKREIKTYQPSFGGKSFG